MYDIRLTSSGHAKAHLQIEIVHPQMPKLANLKIERSNKTMNNIMKRGSENRRSERFAIIYGSRITQGKKGAYKTRIPWA